MHLERNFESTKQTGAMRCYPADTQNGASGISFLRTKSLKIFLSLVSNIFINVSQILKKTLLITLFTFMYEDETKIRRQLTLLRHDGPDRSDMSSRVQTTLIY